MESIMGKQDERYTFASQKYLNGKTFVYKVVNRFNGAVISIHDYRSHADRSIPWYFRWLYTVKLSPVS